MPFEGSLAEDFVMSRTAAERSAWLDTLSAGARERLLTEWRWWSRAGQCQPPPPWRTWLVMAGRGYGKTRIGAEWVRAAAEADGSLRIALVAASLGEARRVMIEGESGLLAIASDHERPIWEPSLGRLKWPSGAVAQVFSAAEPEGLRGPQHHIAWADEIAKWNEGERAWDNLAMTLRLGRHQRVVATTTPKAVPLVLRLRGEPTTAVTRGASAANRAHLGNGFLAEMQAKYGDTRLGRQELEGELIEDAEGALWSRELLERCRAKTVPETERVVIGVDPPAGSKGDACGIVAVGLGRDGIAYVIEDATVQRKTPQGWANAVARCAARHNADKVLAESNQGGDMVREVLKAAAADMPVALVHALAGKGARAEPVALHYEAGRVKHAGRMRALEDELCGMIQGGGYAGPGRSPDRADALVWAVSDVLAPRGVARVRVVDWRRAPD